MVLLLAKPAKLDPLEEFLSDPVLTVACILLIVVSIGWLVITRLIVRNRRRAALRGLIKVKSRRPERDMWQVPP